MTPAARLEMAIQILEGLEKTAQPADRFLKAWFRARRFAGSKDRRAIAEQVFAVQRHRAQLSHRMGSDDGAPRALVIASLVEAGQNIEALFTGGYGPRPLSDAERRAIAAPPPLAPAWVLGEYPLWLEPELIRAFGNDLAGEMAALIPRAPVDLRVNTRKAGRDEVMAALKADGIESAPTPYAPQGIRIAHEVPGLSRTPLFESGAFEFQDEAAQIAAILCNARPGERVLDLAAGAGGKSLALAGAMQDQGEIIACDVRGHALAELARRAGRAGVSIIRTLSLDRAQPEGAFDLVLVDAPCSGTGIWRRQPELRWRLTEGRLAELTGIQDRLLDKAAGLVGPGGRLVYATCSILPAENQDRAEAFRARQPGFAALDLRDSWPKSGTLAPPGLGEDFRASPGLTGTDGFYCAGFRRAQM
jgi:16S rRNA (cytosine967-C5)-methyltransferase